MSDDQTPANPPLLGGIVPYLMLEDAAGAIDFYKRALAAEEVGERYVMDGVLVNSRVDINGGSLMLMDPQQGEGPAKPQAFNLNLTVSDADAWYDRAVAAGCEVIMPIGDQFWGDRYGMVKDPFGVVWAFASPLKA